MSPPEQSPNPGAIKDRIDEVLHGLELEPEETAAILSFANRELPYLLTPQTSYFLLGSYREPYVRRLRTVQNLLNRRLQAYAFLMGDLPAVEIDRLPTFRIRFHLLAAYADFVVAVYEQDAGGEVTELGKISETPYFEKSYVLPRDYAWMTTDNLGTKEDVVAAAVRIQTSEPLSETEKRDEIEKLLEGATSAGLEVTEESVVDEVDARIEADTDVPSYSWVHLNEFRLFELHDRCGPWTRETDLAEAVDVVPSPSR